MTNAERAEFGAKAIPQGNPDHADSMLSEDKHCGLETTAGDTVANILHYVQQQGADVAAVVRMAVENFRAEIQGTDWGATEGQELLAPSPEYVQLVRAALVGDKDYLCDGETADALTDEHRLLLHDYEQRGFEPLAAGRAVSTFADLEGGA